MKAIILRSVIAFGVTLGAYVCVGFFAFGEERAILVGDKAYLLHLSASLLNESTSPGNVTSSYRIGSAMDLLAKEQLPEYEAAHQRLVGKKGSRPVPRWFTARLDYDDKFQRKSWLHTIYPWFP